MLKLYLLKSFQRLQGISELNVRLWKLIDNPMLLNYQIRVMIFILYRKTNHEEPIKAVLLENYLENYVANFGLDENDVIVVEVLDQKTLSVFIDFDIDIKRPIPANQSPSYEKFWENNNFLPFSSTNSEYFNPQEYKKIKEILSEIKYRNVRIP